MSIKRKILTVFFSAFLIISFNAHTRETQQTTDAAYKKVLSIEHWVSKNGAQVYYVERTSLPILDIRIAFEAGSNRDGQLAGLANLTGNLLNQGTPSMSADQIAEGFDNLGVNFTTNTDQDMTVVSLRTLTRENILNPALKFFSEILAQPNFPKDAVDRVKNITLNLIRTNLQDPEVVANQNFYKLLYPNFPYGHAVMGTIEGVSPITQEDVKKFYQNHYVAHNAILVIVGNVSKEQAHTISDSILNQLPQGSEPTNLSEPTQPVAQTMNTPFPATQASIRIGGVGIARNDPDYFPLMVGNYILGGGSVSRLFEVVREQYGFSYDISSYFLPLKYRGPFVISLQTRNEKTQEAIKVSKEVFDRFIKDGPTNEELIAAKKYLTGSFPSRIDSNSEISRYVLLIGFYHLPIDYLDTYRAKINAVSTAQIHHAFQTHLNPKDLITVVVGGQGG